MKKKYCKSISNYRQYVNTWWWGKTITLVSTDGYSTVELQFDNSLPNIAVIKGLMVFTTRQHEGYGTEMMNLCEHIAKKEDAKFIQLSVNKEHVLLVNWYERLGFTIIQEDEHEYGMLKALDNYQNRWKPSDELDEASYQVGIKRVLENPESYGLTKYNWKPSDEQMTALKNALNDAIWQYDHKGSPLKEEITRKHAEAIESLYNDLKKLK